MLIFYNESLKENNDYFIYTFTVILNYINNKLAHNKSAHEVITDSMNKISNNIDSIELTDIVDNVDILFMALEKIKKAFEAIDDNNNKLNKIKTEMEKIKLKLNKNTLDGNFFTDIDNINSLYSDYKSQIENNDNIITEFLSYYINNSSINIEKSTSSVDLEKDKAETAIEKTNENAFVTSTAISDNNVLLISQKDNLVYLPYLEKDVYEIFNNNKTKYKSPNDVISEKYVVSLDKFKNPVVARFREAFNLMKYKEKASIAQCLDLALELAFNSYLNPAIITACKNLNELDVYLDYLDTNEIDKFKIFEVKFELPPI